MPNQRSSSRVTGDTISTRRTRAQTTEPVETSAAARAKAPRKLRSATAEPTELLKLSVSNRASQGEDANENPVVNKRGRPRKSAASVPDLNTVEEVVGNVEDEQQAQLDGQLDAQLQEGAQNAPLDGFGTSRRVSQRSAASAMSGTTAKTSFSEGELEQMDADEMIDNLPSLASAGGELARVILSQGANTPLDDLKDIRLVGSRRNKRYKKLLQTFQLYKPDFGSEEYIRLGLVSRALFGATGPNSRPSTDPDFNDLIKRINLSQMLNALLVNCKPDDWNIPKFDTLARLVDAFPAGIASDEYREADLDFWLQVAAQLAVVKLDMDSQADPNFKPHEVINDLFYEDGEFRHLRTLHLDLLAASADEGPLSMVDDVVSNLKAPFKPNLRDMTAAIGTLKSRFAWDEFTKQVLYYSSMRDAQLEEAINNAGGVQKIQSKVSSAVELKTRRAKLAERKTLGGYPLRKSSDGKDAMALLKRAEKRVKQRASIADMQSTAADSDAPRYQGDALQRDQAGMEEAPRTKQQDPAQVVKPPRSFLDPQPNAQRISTTFDEEISQQPGQNQRPKTPVQPEILVSSQSSKRTHTQMQDGGYRSFSPTQDDGLQTDIRDSSMADRRRVEMQSTLSSRLFPGSTSRDFVEAGPSNPVQQVQRSSPAKRRKLDSEDTARRNPGSRLPERMPDAESEAGELPPGSQYEVAKTYAKLNRVAFANTKAVRARQPWSQDEEATLIRLIEEKGVSWSGLKALDRQGDNILHRRTAEDMRFKARTMKTVMLLAGGNLPENFEYVVLAKGQIEKVLARGIEYEQDRIRGRAESMEFDE